MNALDLVEEFVAHGCTRQEALEFACAPMDGELVVVQCNRFARTLEAAPNAWDEATHRGSWDDFAPRYCGPWATPSFPCPGDFVTPRKVAHG